MDLKALLKALVSATILVVTLVGLFVLGFMYPEILFPIFIIIFGLACFGVIVFIFYLIYCEEIG